MVVGGGGGDDKHPLEWTFRGEVGGLKQKCPPSVRGMNIFWNYAFTPSLNMFKSEAV